MPYKDIEMRKAKQREQYRKHREARVAYQRRYAQENKERQRDYNKLWYELNRESVLLKSRNYYLTHKNHLNELKQNKALALKIEVLTHYGNNRLACVECGENQLACLTIDHITRGGMEHKRTIGGRQLYYWLKLHGLPEGYQTLCMNCQFLKEWGILNESCALPS